MVNKLKTYKKAELKITTVKVTSKQKNKLKIIGGGNISLGFRMVMDAFSDQIDKCLKGKK
jgi:hypothetical protein